MPRDCHPDLGSAFTPYDIQQIDATIIDLERYRASAYNANFLNHRGREVNIDFAVLLAYLCACSQIPFKVQLGGFADRDYPFTSRKIRPYERSFSIQDDNAVLMRWPVDGEAPPPPVPTATPVSRVLDPWVYPATLDIIRYAAEAFGVLHSYHCVVTDVDNDLFLIGVIEAKAMTAVKKSALEAQGRLLMSMPPPVIIEIGLENICIAAYEDDRLPVFSTRTWLVTDRKVDDKFTISLFA